MKKVYLYTLTLCCALIYSACVYEKMPFKPEEIKRRILDTFPTLQDTSFIGLTNLSQNTNAHWTLVYNKEQMPPFIYIYDAEDRLVPPKRLFIKRPDCIVEKVLLNDVNQDGALELLVYLYYDYGISYKGREVVIYANPFDTETHKVKEIFTHPLEQIWKKIDSFDMEYGIPKHSERVGVEMTIEYFEQIIQLRGTYETKKNVLREFKWSTDKQFFELLKHEELHEAIEVIQVDTIALAAAKNRILLEVVAHELDCRSFVLEDNQGRALPIPQHIKEALYCSPVTSIAPNGEYLIYTNKAKKTLDVYEFATQRNSTLIDKIGAIEGISDIAWIMHNKALYAACILVNPEEYLYNTKVAIFKMQYNAPPQIKLYDKSAWYICNARTGSCTPRIDEDYNFNNKGGFTYRLRDHDLRLEQFDIIPLF